VQKFLMVVIALYAMEGMAAVQDYQVIRLIMMKSECVQDQLTRTDKSDGSIEFLAHCKNLSHYPDGLHVVCSDGEDERSCKVQTQAKQFNSLKLLQSSE
jgi:predicted NAD/FAD-binding protein